MESINVKIDDLSIFNLCDDNDVNEPNWNHVNEIIAPIDVASSESSQDDDKDSCVDVQS